MALYQIKSYHDKIFWYCHDDFILVYYSASHYITSYHMISHSTTHSSSPLFFSCLLPSPSHLPSSPLIFFPISQNIAVRIASLQEQTTTPCTGCSMVQLQAGGHRPGRADIKCNQPREGGCNYCVRLNLFLNLIFFIFSYSVYIYIFFCVCSIFCILYSILWQLRIQENVELSHW